jgi:Predicted membrane protein (DUF2306)
MRFSSLLKPNLTAPTKLTVVGLAACAVAIWIQWLSGDPAYPKFPPGPVFFVVVAVIVALGSRWWWTPVLGALVALLTTLGWFSRLPAELLRLSHPAQVGNFATGIFIGTLLQLIALLVTDVAGLAATAQNYRSTSHGEGGLVKTVCKVLGGYTQAIIYSTLRLAQACSSSAYSKAAIGRKREIMKPDVRIRRALWSVVILLALIAVAVAMRRTAQLVPVLINGYGPPTAASNPVAAQFAALDDVFARHPVLTLIHILPGLLFVLLGPLQFSRTLRQRHLRWRRWSGRICLLFGLVIGVSALVMSFWIPSIGGLNQATASTLFALFFLFALGKTFRHIRRREIALHREWMIRAFSIGIAIATIRPIIVLLFLISRPSGLTPYEFFGAGFWLGFVLHLMAAEAWIHWTQSQLRADRLLLRSRRKSRIISKTTTAY